jgi:hypothetical protein
MRRSPGQVGVAVAAVALIAVPALVVAVRLQSRGELPGALDAVVGLSCGEAEDQRWDHYRGAETGAHPNALWARHEWVGESHSDCEYRTFARQIRQLGLTDVFFHAGPFRPDGTVTPDRHAHARTLIDTLHDLVPGVRLQAYLGQVEGTDPEDLDLSDPIKRERVVDTATEFLNLGFDGIHYDIEPIRNGDQRFIDLFDRTRAVTGPRDAVLSIAVEERLVDPDSGFPPNVQTASVSDDWLRTLADHVDQIAIMVYDSRMKTDADYERWTEYQARTIGNLVADRATVFIGIPTDKAFVYYHTASENAGTGARGLRRGVAALPPERARRVGGAIFAEWVSTEDDYRTVEQEWVRPPGP